jgi:hypothetical protein
MVSQAAIPEFEFHFLAHAGCQRFRAGFGGLAPRHKLKRHAEQIPQYFRIDTANQTITARAPSTSAVAHSQFTNERGSLISRRFGGEDCQ